MPSCIGLAVPLDHAGVVERGGQLRGQELAFLPWLPRPALWKPTDANDVVTLRIPHTIGWVGLQPKNALKPAASSLQWVAKSWQVWISIFRNHRPYINLDLYIVEIHLQTSTQSPRNQQQFFYYFEKTKLIVHIIWWHHTPSWRIDIDPLMNLSEGSTRIVSWVSVLIPAIYFHFADHLSFCRITVYR